jgi:predicted DNA-binding protein
MNTNKNTDPEESPLKQTKKRLITSVEFPDELAEKIQLAIRVTGKTKKDIILDALKAHLPEILASGETELAALKAEIQKMTSKDRS